MTHPSLDKADRESVRSSARTLRGPARRAFQATIALRYCGGNPARAEKLFGWGREAVALGLHEVRTGFICFSARAAFSGNKLWEEKHPEIMSLLRQLARSHGSIHPPSRKGVGQGWLTAKGAIQVLREHGVGEEILPSITTMTEVLKRNGFRPVSVRNYRPDDHDGQPPSSLPMQESHPTVRINASGRSPGTPFAGRNGYLPAQSTPEPVMAN